MLEVSVVTLKTLESLRNPGIAVICQSMLAPRKVRCGLLLTLTRLSNAPQSWIPVILSGSQVGVAQVSAVVDVRAQEIVAILNAPAEAFLIGRWNDMPQYAG